MNFFGNAFPKSLEIQAKMSHDDRVLLSIEVKVKVITRNGYQHNYIQQNKRLA